MKKTITVLCILLCFLLVGGIFFWKNQKQEEEKPVEYYDPCAVGGGRISLGEFGNVCVFDDGSFCSAVSFLNGECKKGDKYEEIKYSDNESLLYCPLDYEPVCGEDGFVYMNNCIIERQGIQKSKTHKPVKGACVPMDESEIAALNAETGSVETGEVESGNVDTGSIETGDIEE